VLRCYREYQVKRAPDRSFDQILEDVINNPDVVHLGRGRDKPRVEEVKAAGVVVQHKKSGREVIIRKEARDKFLPNWAALRRRPDVTRRWNKDKGHETTKRKLHKSLPQVRVYSFTLPGAQ
jgi:hypothetical protein